MLFRSGRDAIGAGAKWDRFVRHSPSTRVEIGSYPANRASATAMTPFWPCVTLPVALWYRDPQHPVTLVRLEGAKHLWRRVPPSELSIALVAIGRRGRATGPVEAP